MKRIARLSSFAQFRPRMSFSFCLILIIVSSFSSAEIDNRNGSKATYVKEEPDLIKSAKKSVISQHQDGNNKIGGGRNYSAGESSVISGEKSSVALNRFLDDVLKAQNDLKWIDHAARRFNHRTRLDNSLAHVNQHSTVSVNTKDVLGRADIGYESRLRGKRGFDRNYETMWMLQKKKYAGENIRGVPRRIYLDNDETFKNDADSANFALYRSLGMLDRPVYERGTMADQPLKDWTRKKDLHSSGHWPNSNENFKVTNGEGTWLRDYKPARKILVNSDLIGDEEKSHVGADTRDQLLFDSMHADDLTALRESPIAVAKISGKSRNTPLSLESLRKTILKLRNSLVFDDERKNVISKESKWWNNPQLAAEIIDLEKRDLDDYPDEEIMWRIRKDKNLDDEDETASRSIYQGAENSKESHDRSKRRRRSFIAELSYLNNQANIPENKSRQKSQMMKDTLGNTTGIQKSNDPLFKLNSTRLDNDKRNSINASNKRDISELQYLSKEESLSSNYFVNLTIVPLMNNKTEISGLKYPLTKSSLSNYSTDSTLFAKSDPQTHSLEHIAINKVSSTSSKEINQSPTTETVLKSTHYTARIYVNLSSSEKNLLPSNVIFVNSTNNGTIGDSQKSVKNRSNDEKLGIAARKISRYDADDGQSKGAGEKSPRGNTSRGFSTAANESRSCIVETTASERGEAEGELERANETREENDEPIPSMIKVFELQEHPYQKQEAETAARLSWRLEGDGMSVAQMKTNDVDESRNAGDDSSSPKLIDPVIGATARPKAANINTDFGEFVISKDQREEFASTIADNNLRKQQQMVPPLSAGNRKANKSNGNSDTDQIDIRALGSNGNETMNVKGGTPTAMEAHEYPESGNNLRRKLLWISVDAKTEDALIDAKSGLNTMSESRTVNIIQENDRRQSNIIANSPKCSEILIRVKREDDSTLQDALNIKTSDTNLHARYKRAAYSFENSKLNNEGDSANMAEKEAAINRDEKQENNEEYLNQNVEELKGDYNDGEEVIEDNNKKMEHKRGERFSAKQQINPAKAEVDMMIQEKLNKKKIFGNYKRKKRALDMIEYYDYQDDEGQEHDAPINEREVNKFLIDDKAKIKREGKISCGLGKKKNENAEEMMKQERQKMRTKNKEPKEEIIVDLGQRRNKTAKDSRSKKLSDSSGSNFEDGANEEGRPFAKEDSGNTYQSNLANNVYREESADARSKWLDRSFDNRMPTSKNSESALDNPKKKIDLDERLGSMSNERMDADPDIIGNVVLDIQPIKILDQSKEQKASEDTYKDSENERSEDDYYDQENEDLNNVKPLYEELKNVYDWPDGELKSGPRLKGDQRLRYESDDKLDRNPSQLQPLNDRFFSNQNNDASKRFYSPDASWTSSTSNYLALKVTDDMFKGGSEQGSSAEENSNVFSDSQTGKVKVSKITEDENSPFSKESVIERPMIDTDSGFPYENCKYIEPAPSKVWKRNMNTEKQVSISSQDLHESFIESLDWHDDFDDNAMIRFGRGLKAVDETVISDLIKSREQDNKSDIANATNVSSELHSSSPMFDDNSSTSQDWYNNTIPDSIDIFNVHRGASDQGIKKVQQSILMNMDGDEDLEAAEQKYINHQTPRIKRTAPSYSAFYDVMNHNRRDSEEADKNLEDSFQLPNIFKDRSDRVYDGGYATPYWNNNIQDLDSYFKMPQSINSQKKEKSGKKNKHFSDKHVKKGDLHSSLSRNRRHHTHRSDMSKNADGDDWQPKKKDKSEDKSSLTGRTRVQKSKTAEKGFLRAGVNEAPGEKVLYENAEDQSTVKSEENDARRKEITLLLAADNVDNESQMDVALHGELAGKIVEQIFEQVQKNDQLKSVLAPGLHRRYKTEDVIAADNIYRQGFNKTGMNRTETMMQRIMELLGELILNEVQRKTCVFLSPDMRGFLGWMLRMEEDQEEGSFEETLPLPLVHEEIIPEQDSRRKFLFDATSIRKEEENISNLQKKVRVLETLAKEYNALTTKEKAEVQTVHDYLIRQLNELLRYIETREAAGKSALTPTGGRNILQYQSATPNITNASYLMTKGAFSSPIGHVEPRHREIRSLDKVSTKQHRKIKRQRTRKNRKNVNRRKPIQKHKKHRKHQDRARSSPGFGRSRRKRANLKENDSLYIGYEKPTIYDSFDLLDAKLTEKKEKRKRELVDKKNAATENDRMLDLLPIKEKNRLEDEVILLNKREAWKRANEEQLKEVAFGKDMRNITRKEKERLEKLAKGDKRKPIDEASFRTKREGIIRGISAVRGADRSDKNHTASEIGNGKSEKNLKSRDDNGNNGARREDKLEWVERRINVFADNRDDAATDTAVAAEVSAGEKLAINAGANNQVKRKLCGINRETKIDKAVGSTSRANLTSDTKPRVSEERRKVSEAEKETDDNAVKLNQTTNYRSEETDPEIELKNLKREREERIYGVAERKMTDLLYDDDNRSRNKFTKKYVAKLDEPGDLDAVPENNFELLRLRSNKWSNDVVEWKLLPVIKRSSYYDDRALPRRRLIERGIPAFSHIKDVELKPNVYLSSPKLWRSKYRRKKNKIRPINDDDAISRGIHSKTKQAFEIARFEDPRSSKMLLEARLRNSKKSNNVAEFAVPFILKASDHELPETSRSHSNLELGVPMIYDGLRLPVWSYHDDPPILHFVPDIRARDGDVYFKYGLFKERARDLNRQVARQNRFRLRTSAEEAVDFPGNNLGNKSSESRFAHGKFRVKTDEPALANHEDYFVSNETKDTQKLKKNNIETKINLKD